MTISVNARIVICQRGGQVQVNLTNGAEAWDVRRYTRPAAALGQVRKLEEQGHRVAFASALADLERAAVNYRTN